MKYRKLRIAFSAVCGVLCLLLIVLWVRSYWHCDTIERKSGGYFIVVGSVRGLIGYGSVLLDSPVLAPSWKLETYPPDYGEKLPFLGFHFQSSLTSSSAFVPYWFLIIAMTTMGALPSIGRFKRRFSLRTLLIAVTLIGLILGTIIATSR